MSLARPNPIGLRVDGGQVVRVGEGLHTHLLDPYRGAHLCRSGFNAGKRGGSGASPEYRPTPRATVVTCYRCIKLAQINMDAGRKPWESS